MIIPCDECIVKVQCLNKLQEVNLFQNSVECDQLYNWLNDSYNKKEDFILKIKTLRDLFAINISWVCSDGQCCSLLRYYKNPKISLGNAHTHIVGT